MANFSAPILNITVSTAFKTAGALWGATSGARREQIYEYEFGQVGALSSTDIQVLWDVSRFSVTASLAGSSVVPNLLDQADTSPIAQFLNAATAETTYTGANFGLSLKQWGINQRGS